MESAVKRKHSSDATVARAPSSVVPETESHKQKKRRGQSPRTGSAKNVKNDSSVQDPGTSGEGRPPSVDTSTGYECSICLESTRRNKMKSLPCSHAFHQACIDAWLIEDRRCPVCRQKTAPPQNARPPSNNQRQIIFEELQALPGMRFVTNNVRLNNGGINIRLNNGGINMRFNNGGFRRLNNGGNVMVNIGRTTMVNNGGIEMRLSNGGIEMRLNNGGFMILNNGGIRMNNFNI
ncbi:hypothetical protein AVEN_132360-1 [Araneus ventricosus]|uniref:RING-type domain-containing protein n=1 Tax=Araneus ventricosus TaxID=182803 RepID=A0A4Y2MR18_ARAVE|nr:hypothetical protein AVEN_132360-1 [Araneus ventricosus]